MSVMRYTNNDRKRVQNVMKGMMSLILQGVKVELAYLSAKNLNQDYSVRMVKRERKIKKLVHHMKAMDKMVKSQWRNQTEIDVNAKLAELEGRSNSDFATELYSFLTTKYDWRYWLVVAYDDVRRPYKHHQCVADGGVIKFLSHGRNLVVSSVHKAKSPINITDARNLLSSVPNVIRRSIHKRRRGATYIYRKLLNSTLHCEGTYAAVGVMRNSAHITHKGPSNRLIYLDNEKFRMHLFG